MKKKAKKVTKHRSVAGLYLWEVKVDDYYDTLLITTRLHAPEIAIVKAEARMRSLGFARPRVYSIERAGTLDA